VVKQDDKFGRGLPVSPKSIDSGVALRERAGSDINGLQCNARLVATW
jgi:hypothetical protein